MTIALLNADVSLTNTAVVLLSSSISNSLTFTRVTITNTDTVAHNVTLYRVPSGGSPGTGNIIVAPGNFPGNIAAGETLAIPLTGHSLVSGQSLYGKANTSSVVNLSISYVQQS